VPDPKTGQPVPVWCGRIEQHITADVVHGAWRYWQATGNARFRDRFLTPLAVETARFWASRVEQDGEQYVIRDVIGPDEYHEHVDNNAFTNVMARRNLRLAAELAPKDPDAEHWTAIADELRVPYDDDLGIIAQDDHFLELEQADPRELSSRVSEEPEKERMAKIWKSQVLKQADVIMLLMLWPDAFSQRLKQDCWRYYEPRTTHDSSLSASAHAIVASDLGLRRAAYDYFRLTASTDLANPQGNTEQGLHAAALGGTWQAVVRGFLGIRTDGEELRIDPHLPRRWNEVELQVRHRGSRLALKVTRDSLRVEKLSGRSPSAIRVGRRTHKLWLHEAVSIPL
jgi:trehalose/maltose hydrolase-like predicted phosphorylase